MHDTVKWLRIIALLLAILVVQTGWVGIQLLLQPAQAQSGPLQVLVVGPGSLGCPSLRTCLKPEVDGSLWVTVQR